MSRVILPGSVIGVLGSGQLGRMFTIAARRMGYRVQVLSPDDDTPTGQVADVEIQADYEDMDIVARFAQGVDVMTFEFENVPVATAEVAARSAPVRPAGQVLHTTQNRLREKTFLRNAGLPVTPFAAVRAESELDQAIAAVGLPAVLKTANWGYDGKGQARVASHPQAVQALHSLGGGEAVLERWIELASELSVVAVRGLDGDLACFAPITNIHRHHILDVSRSPADVAAQIAAAAIEIARAVMTHLEVVGAVRGVLRHAGRRPADQRTGPAPHNSGHLTIDAPWPANSSSRSAVCGLPLASTEKRGRPPWSTCWAISGPTVSRLGPWPVPCRMSSCTCTASRAASRPQDGPLDRLGRLTPSGGRTRPGCARRQLTPAVSPTAPG